MQRNLIIPITILLIFGCETTPNMRDNYYDLPLDKQYIWHYDITSFDDKPRFRDRDSTVAGVGVRRDTIQVFIENEKHTPEVQYFIFNKSIARFWYKGIGINRKGYFQYYGGKIDSNLQNENLDYLIKFPIEKGQKWKYYITEGYKISEYTAVDTVITVNGVRYDNCVELTIKQGFNNSDTSFIKIYFNNEMGLIYYNDPFMLEEVKLIKMEER